MCGILLIISKNKLDKNNCLKAESFIKSRGPDFLNNSFFSNGRIFLSNSILSITGQKKNKNKLIKSRNGKYILSFNGEIYNWKDLLQKFKLVNCKNDSELLVNMFESLNPTKVSKSINGMFAYCVYDKSKNRINFASDSQGEKKLFLYKSKSLIIISSTIKSILSYIKKDILNTELIKSYFYSRHMIYYEDTIFKNIKVVNPGFNYNLDIKKFTMNKKRFDNPLKWISKKRYLENKKKNFSYIYLNILNVLQKQIRLMIPNTRFACVLSGGIDSSVQTALISKIKKPNSIGGLVHKNKDRVAETINKFEKFLPKNITKIKVDKNNYLKNFQKSLKVFASPFLTHSFIGSYQISKYFKLKRNKVFFVADGVDELLGGYELYRKIKWKSGHNCSPYSNIDINCKLKRKIDKFWSSAFKRYNKFLTKKDASIEASLFTDYFIQSVYVANIGTDIMCSNNGIEPRNVFIQKDVIKEFLNLPLKYKINFKVNKKKLLLKYILKKIFINFYSEKLVSPKKQGFSGFPNSSRLILKDKKFSYLKKLIYIEKLRKDYINEWKFLNLEFFLSTYKKNISNFF